MLTIKKPFKRDNEISNMIDEYLKYIKIKQDEFKLEFANGEKGYRKKDEKWLDNTLDRKPGELEVSKELQKINKGDLLVICGFNCLYSSAQIEMKKLGRKSKQFIRLKKIKLNQTLVCLKVEDEIS